MASEFKSANLNTFFQNVRLGIENEPKRANNIRLVDQSSALGEDSLANQDSVEKIFAQHRLKGAQVADLQEISTPKSSMVGSDRGSRLHKYLNNSLESSIISDVPDHFEANDSHLEEEPQIVQLPAKKQNKFLGFSRDEVSLHLVQTESTVQTLKLVNRHNKRISLQASLSDPVSGIEVVCPATLEPLSTCEVVIEISEVDEIGDIFNSIAVEATCKEQKECFEIPLTIRYTVPKLTVEYEGASQVITLSQGKFMDIKLPQNSFREHSLYLSSKERLEVELSTPRVEGTVFPDDLVLLDGSKRKVGVRCRDSRFCLVAKIKNTQLAFVFRVTVY